MSGRILGSTEAQLSVALAWARAGQAAAPSAAAGEGAFGVPGFEAAEASSGATEAREERSESAIVDLSRPPFPCSSDGLDLYTVREVARRFGLHKRQAGPKPGVAPGGVKPVSKSGE